MMVGGTTDCSSPSIVPMAYVELLRTVAARLAACDDASGASYQQIGSAGVSSEHEGVTGAWAAIRAMDLRALFW